jgi:RNA polymerase sigma factor for flagellar operon FliA
MTMDTGEWMNATTLQRSALQGLAKQNGLSTGQSIFEDGIELAGMLAPLEPLFTPFIGDSATESVLLSTNVASVSSIATDRDQMLIEHLPTVRYIARRIHERLPQHVELDDLVSAGVVGLIDAFAKFDHGKKVQFRATRSFEYAGRFWTRCGRWTGVRGSFAEKAVQWKRRSDR